jgi:hypothetical protein
MFGLLDMQQYKQKERPQPLQTCPAGWGIPGIPYLAAGNFAI